jgi:hypothetical protein
MSSTVYSLYIFIDVNFSVREREKKNRTMVTQMCRLSVCPLSFFFHSLLFFSPTVGVCTQGSGGQKKGKESMYVCVHTHIYSFVVMVGVYVRIERQEETQRGQSLKDTTSISLFALCDMVFAIMTTFTLYSILFILF